MSPKSKVLSLAVAVALTGCASAPEQKQAQHNAEPGIAVETHQDKKIERSVVEPAIQDASPVVPVEAVAVKDVAPAAVSKPVVLLSTDPNTFIVSSDVKGSSHPSHGKGSKVGFLVNGIEGKDVSVIRSEAYTFKVNTGVQHDFYLTTNDKGWGGGTYTDGVGGQFVHKGDVTFTPTQSAPDLLYYQCRNHKYMGGKIYVLDKGEGLAELKATLAAKMKKTQGPKRRVAVVTVGSVKQKLGYAQMVLSSSSAKRVEASGNPNALALLEDAKVQINTAKESLAGGDASKAMDEVNEGLRQITAASRAITTESEMAGVNHKAKHDEILASLKTYEGSYAKNTERVKKAGNKPKSTLDRGVYNGLITEGKALAVDGKYAAGNKKLSNAQKMITSVLTEMLHAQTMVYDKSFDTPKEEYEYELARMESYEELVPIAIEQRQPSQRALELIDGFVNKGKKIKQEGKDIAAKGDYKMGIMAMQAATSNLQRALRIAGVN